MIYFTLYTNKFIPKGSAGCSRTFFILIKPEYKDDIGLHKHEIKHVRQFWSKGLIIFSIRYKFSKTFRLKCEVEAYKEQLVYPPANNSEEYKYIYAHYISEDYGLSITFKEAFNLLN